MLIHSYLTSGFVKMAEVFLKSLDMVTKPSNPPVWLDGRGLSSLDINSLSLCYPRELLHIRSHPLHIASLADMAGVTPEQLKKYKRECEGRFVSQKNKVWKLMTAGDDRVMSLQNILFHGSGNRTQPGPDWQDFSAKGIAHFDIDTLFRKPIDMIPKMMDEADIWLKLRPGHNIVKARITIDCIIVKPTQTVRFFFDRWRHYINRIQPKDRPIGYGQTSCWLAFEEVKHKLNYKTLPLIFGLPGRNKRDQVIWCGNVHKLGKDDCVKMFKREAGLK